jgi:hypothetical protein
LYRVESKIPFIEALKAALSKVAELKSKYRDIFDKALEIEAFVDTLLESINPNNDGRCYRVSNKKLMVDYLSAIAVKEENVRKIVS